MTASPWSIAQLIGAAPRYFGSSEACRLTLPSRAWFTAASPIFWPKAITTIASAGGSGSAFRSAVRVTGRPNSAATAATGVGVSFLPRPAGRSGCV